MSAVVVVLDTLRILVVLDVGTAAMQNACTYICYLCYLYLCYIYIYTHEYNIILCYIWLCMSRYMYVYNYSVDF